jgi:hypothetical protein
MKHLKPYHIYQNLNEHFSDFIIKRSESGERQILQYNSLNNSDYEKLEYWSIQDHIDSAEDEILDEMVDEYVISKGFPLKSVDKTPNEFEDKGSVDFRREYVFDVDTLPFICDMVIQKYEDDWWLIECFIPLKTSIKLRDVSSQVNSRRWVCQGIEGLELCLQNLFKLID